MATSLIEVHQLHRRIDDWNPEGYVVAFHWHYEVLKCSMWKAGDFYNNSAEFYLRPMGWQCHYHGRYSVRETSKMTRVLNRALKEEPWND